MSSPAFPELNSTRLGVRVFLASPTPSAADARRASFAQKSRSYGLFGTRSLARRSLLSTPSWTGWLL